MGTLTLAPITGTYVDASNTPATGYVGVRPVARLSNSDTPRVITEAFLTAALDVAGKATVDVVPSDDPDWQLEAGETVWYEVRETITGLPVHCYYVEVPAAGVDLSEVDRAADYPHGITATAVGPAGPAGADGPAGPGLLMKGSVPTSGDLPPTGNQVGDTWLAEDTDDLWTWDGATWVNVGPAGVPGPEGPAGADGADSTVPGPQGDPGPKGDTGDTGPQGPQGDQGLPGADGADGADGTGQWEGPMTQAEFDAIPVPDPALMYVVVG